uniref:Uncharacterized protein n=1 Tax=viral metagenome TaxID=1070528 RepID=A0A6M3JP84_9ZZZZ
MCTSYTPPYIPKPTENWKDFWKELCSKNKGKHDDPIGIFIELTRGCQNKRCIFKCDEFGKKEEIIIPPSQIKFIEDFVPSFLFESFYLNVSFFGQGRIDNYPFSQGKYILSGKKQFFNFHADIDKKYLMKTLECIANPNISINCHSIDDAILANRFIEVKGIVACIPVLKFLDWVEIFKIVKLPVLFRGLSDKNNPGYLTGETFANRLKKATGLNAEIYYLKPTNKGLRPVLEKISLNEKEIEFTLRRCFRRLDSDKISLVFKIDGTKKNMDDRKQIERFASFLKKDTPCKLCYGGAWKAIIKA